jgi:hypothetical protein
VSEIHLIEYRQEKKKKKERSFIISDNKNQHLKKMEGVILKKDSRIYRETKRDA